MDSYKEFQGKNLDECIEAACSYFDAPREKLEIEIVQAAKSGIFGIVGARKAIICARRAKLNDAVQNILGHPAREAKKYSEEKKDIEKTPVAETASQSLSGGATALAVNAGAPAGEENKKAESQTPMAHEGPSGRPKKEEAQKKSRKHSRPVEKEPDFISDAPVDDLEEAADGLRVVPLEELDKERLVKLTKKVVAQLTEPIAGRTVDINVELAPGRVRAKIDWHGDAGLLIGKEGQTLAALQYLASRVISRQMDAILRVQMDIGDYRKRQDDKLRELAKNLAEKARSAGKSFSTRPLSSYHRRIIHLSLQNEPDIQTRSSGEGPLKRVLIAPRRS